MPRDQQVLVFVGIKNAVFALDETTGVEVWGTALSGSDYVTVCWDGTTLLAGNNGEVWRLDPATGGILWHNGFKGFGRGVVSLATSRAPAASGSDDTAMAKKRRDAQQRAAAAAAAG